MVCNKFYYNCFYWLYCISKGFCFLFCVGMVCHLVHLISQCLFILHGTSCFNKRTHSEFALWSDLFSYLYIEIIVYIFFLIYIFLVTPSLTFHYEIFWCFDTVFMILCDFFSIYNVKKVSSILLDTGLLIFWCINYIFPFASCNNL